MMIKRLTRQLFAVVVAGLLLAGCGQMAAPAAGGGEAVDETAVFTGGGMMGRGMGMGPGGGMMARHHATIPNEYAGLTSPFPPSEASLARGAEVYNTYCATCHGDGGMGDGPSSESLDPAPPAIAHTSQMLGDDYLFWRVSEGGAMEPFNSAMPSWKQALDEQARWDVINYVRALGAGTAPMGGRLGGATFDPEAEQARRADMLATAVAQDVLSQDEADLFAEVHGHMDDLMAAGNTPRTGSATNIEQSVLDQLIERGQISHADAADFSDIHDRLITAGLMQ